MQNVSEIDGVLMSAIIEALNEFLADLRPRS